MGWKMRQNLLQVDIYDQSYKRGEIKYGNLSRKQMWKSMKLGKYLGCGLSLEAYP